jgi:hypothetical protein
MPFPHPELDDQLGPRAVGEELLWNELHSKDSDCERCSGSPDDRPSALHREIDPTPESAIERRLVGIAATVMLAEILRQECDRQVGGNNLHDPRDQIAA